MFWLSVNETPHKLRYVNMLISSHHRHLLDHQARDPQRQRKELEEADARLRLHPTPPRPQYLPSRKSPSVPSILNSRLQVQVFSGYRANSRTLAAFYVALILMEL